MKKFLLEVLRLIEANAKAIVALVSLGLLNLFGWEVPVAVQAAIVTFLVWLIPNKQ